MIETPGAKVRENFGKSKRPTTGGGRGKGQEKVNRKSKLNFILRKTIFLFLKFIIHTIGYLKLLIKYTRVSGMYQIYL